MEYELDGVKQVQVNNKAGLTFATGLRSMMRADPDVMMVGEIRDRETAQIAIESALTGHYVLSTLHTNDAPMSVARLIEMGIEPFLVASGINCVVAQRLARTLCDCKEETEIGVEALHRNGFTDEDKPRQGLQARRLCALRAQRLPRPHRRLRGDAGQRRDARADRGEALVGCDRRGGRGAGHAPPARRRARQGPPGGHLDGRGASRSRRDRLAGNGPVRRLPKPGLLARFALVSLVPILGLGFVLNREIRHNGQEEAVHDARTLAVSVANLRIAPNVQRADVDGAALSPARSQRLRVLVEDALQSTNVARAKLWAPDGRVVFSDDQGVVGKRFPVGHDLEEALAGEVVSEMTELDSAEESRDRRFGRMVEVYVPLRISGTRKPAGVFELYIPYASVAKRIEERTNHTFLLLLGGLLVLWAALFRIAARASRTLRRQAEENLHQATHDSLTGLPNRAAFLDRLDQAGRQPATAQWRSAIDLDRFKEINDTLGHHAGDALLVPGRAAAAAVACGTATRVARLGGDEFAVLLLGRRRRRGTRVAAQRCSRALDAPFDVDGLQR